MELSHAVLRLPARLDGVGLSALEQGLAAAVEGDARVLVLRGEPGAFCAGLDLDASPEEAELHAFAELLLALRGAPLPSIALVEGEALGGGLGLAAACDLVLATPSARFGLPEALFGLVPAMVLPFVEARTGALPARLLALRGGSIGTAEAVAMGLADEICTDPEAALARHVRQLSRAARSSVAWLKALPPALADAVRAGAEQTARRLADPEVRHTLSRFAEGELPWAP